VPSRRAFRALLLRLDRIRQLLVSHPSGTVTLLGSYLVGPRFSDSSWAETHSSPEPYGPVTCPELKKSNNVLKESYALAYFGAIPSLAGFSCEGKFPAISRSYGGLIFDYLFEETQPTTSPITAQ
jgi:hypothetical protein